MYQIWDLSTPEVKQYQPGNYASVAELVVTEVASELVPEDPANPVRFLNISLPSDNTNYVYCVIGDNATVARASFILKPTQQNYNFQINGQSVGAICETGKTVAVNVQIANGVKL